jgi:hypothetical protein
VQFSRFDRCTGSNMMESDQFWLWFGTPKRVIGVRACEAAMWSRCSKPGMGPRKIDNRVRGVDGGLIEMEFQETPMPSMRGLQIPCNRPSLPHRYADFLSQMSPGGPEHLDGDAVRALVVAPRCIKRRHA